MGDIILEREQTPAVVKLDDEEAALLNEIEINDEPAYKPPKRPTAPKRPPIRQQAPPMNFDMEAFTNPNKAQAPKPPRPEFVDYGEEEPEEEYGEDMMMGEEEEPSEMPSPGYSSIDEEKADILNKLARLEKKGHHSSKKFTAYSSIDEMRMEYKRIMYSIEVEQSIRFSRRMLIACITGVEFLNKRYNPFDLQLDGWSESVMENVDDYDGVFEDLYNKYKTKMHVAPEVKLIMMLGGSGMMFHLTNSMFKAAIPNVNDVLKQNPDLMNNMVNAVKNTQMNPQGRTEDPSQRPVTTDASGRHEMRGPGLDLSSLMNGIMMPPPQPMNTMIGERPQEPPPTIDEEESMSDIVSVSGESTGGELRNVNVTDTGKKRRGRKSKKNEINL
jgi:hypothetical protein